MQSRNRRIANWIGGLLLLFFLFRVAFWGASYPSASETFSLQLLDVSFGWLGRRREPLFDRMWDERKTFWKQALTATEPEESAGTELRLKRAWCVDKIEKIESRLSVFPEKRGPLRDHLAATAVKSAFEGVQSAPTDSQAWRSLALLLSDGIRGERAQELTGMTFDSLLLKARGHDAGNALYD